ncbi:chain length determinant family protein [Thalassotalea sp. HSM 43]|uniref:XrtA system polysaccharide chain length determinant n=1 Tax=Thalassotalea sp. HSM 43 TaxID=2552945 RepID=UPI001080FE3B|nr:XrtA system polysaccharide chain length determinant [Thalassotalea sp. HSM 43]QBY04186.1 chain length determinant family protein [Thalassotalea sp. HSM 43]
MHEQIDKIKELLLGVWAKKHYVIISTWLLCPIGWLAVSSLPDQYESSARVYVDTQSLLRPLMKGIMVETDPNQQVRLMVKTLLSRPNLERIARMTDLDVSAKNNDEYESIIDDLKDEISIRSLGKENIYSLSMTSANPQLAKDIVQASLTVFIENTLGETRSDTDTAQRFLQKQINEYESKLLEAERKLTLFKQKYSGIMPSDSGGFYSALSRVNADLKATRLELLEAQTQLSSAKQQLTRENAMSESISENVIDNATVTTTYDERIVQLQTQLDSLLISYTEQHPDVKELRRTLTELKRLRKQELESYFAAIKENPDAQGALNTSATNENLVYQEMRIQVNQLENTVASLKVRVADYEGQANELNSKIHTLPEVEAELVGLNRDYEINKEKYEELLSRRETAALAKQADATSDKIQFRVIDPPRIPLEPSGPMRILFFIAVLIISAGLGAGVAVIVITLSPKVLSAVQLSRESGLPIFGIVAATDNLNIQATYRSSVRKFIVSNLLLFLVLGALITYHLVPAIASGQLRGVF